MLETIIQLAKTMRYQFMRNVESLGFTYVFTLKQSAIQLWGLLDTIAYRCIQIRTYNATKFHAFQVLCDSGTGARSRFYRRRGMWYITVNKNLETYGQEKLSVSQTWVVVDFQCFQKPAEVHLGDRLCVSLKTYKKIPYNLSALTR